MHRSILFCSLLGIALFSHPLAAQNNQRTILLDPGHGGIDSGAIGINGIKEKDIVLEVGREVIRLNRELFGNSLDIYLTRYSDTLIALGHRTRLAKALQVDVFVSIHCNQALRSAAQGVEVYIYPSTNKVDMDLQEKSKTIAKTMLKGFHESLGFKTRGKKQAGFQVLRDLRSTCPAILLELGFLSNPEEAKHSTRKSSISGFALVILETLKMESDAGSY